MSCFQSGHYIGYNLGQNRWEIYTPPPPPPNQGWENGAFCLLYSFILDLAGMGVRCFILFCPRLQLPQQRMFLLGCPIDFSQGWSLTQPSWAHVNAMHKRCVMRDRRHKKFQDMFPMLAAAYFICRDCVTLLRQEYYSWKLKVHRIWLVSCFLRW